MNKKIFILIIISISIFVLSSCNTPQKVVTYRPGDNINDEISYNNFYIDLEEELYIYELNVSLEETHSFQSVINMSAIEISTGDIAVGFGETLGGTLIYGINYYYVINDVKIEELGDFTFEVDASYNIDVVLVFDKLFEDENIPFPSNTEQSVFIDFYGILSLLVNK